VSARQRAESQCQGEAYEMDALGGKSETLCREP
jgi:hypothetical protein